MNRRAIFSGNGGGDLANAMRAFWDAGRAGGCGELVTEALFHKRVAASPANPREVSGRAGVQRPLQDRENGERYRNGFSALLRLDRRHAVANVLAADPREVAAAKAGIKDDVQPNPLSGADRIFALID